MDSYGMTNTMLGLSIQFVIPEKSLYK